MMMGVADTCFLIDWSRFGLRDVLFELFDVVAVPEQVLAEIRREETLSWLARELGREKLQLFTPTPRQLDKAAELVRRSYAMPSIRRLDMPEAVCLIIGKDFDFVVLTENRGALMMAEALPDLSGVRVWRALEVLKECMKRGVLRVSDEEEVISMFKRYEEETLHIFPREELQIAIEEVLGRG